MTFQDFLEHFYAALRKGAPDGLGVPPELAPLGDFAAIRSLVDQAQLFYLEAPDDEAAFMREVGKDALQDLKAALPVPFDNFAIVQEEVLPGHWQFRWLHRLRPGAVLGDSRSLFGGKDQFVLWIYSSAGGHAPDFFSSVRFQYLGGDEIALRLSPESVTRFARGTGRPVADATEALRSIVTGVLLEVGAISHPANFVVGRAPRLTPREGRAVARGEPRPSSKRPHFIVIDYERLVGLNPRTRTEGSKAASPVPHSRRGHWRTLAEACQHARSQGRTKIWIGPTYVGERDFEDERHIYSVRLDLLRPPEPAPAGKGGS